MNKIIVDKKSLPIGRVAHTLGFQVHLLDESKMSIMDSFNRVNPEILIIDYTSLHISAILKNIVSNISKMDVYVLVDIKDEKSIDIINGLKSKIGNVFSIIEYEYAIYDEVFYPAFLTTDKKRKINLGVFSDKQISQPIGCCKIFNKEVIDSPNYCGFLEDHQKAEVFRECESVYVDRQDIYNAFMLGCKINNEIDEEITIEKCNNNSSYKLMKKVV